MASERNALIIRVRGPDGHVREAISEQDSIILGSGAGAAIRIADPQVSQLHLMLKVEQGGVVKAIDLGSEHGTHLGNRLIDAPVALRSGDVLRLGASRVEVLFGTGSPAAAGPQSLREAPGLVLTPGGISPSPPPPRPHTPPGPRIPAGPPATPPPAGAAAKPGPPSQAVSRARQLALDPLPNPATPLPPPDAPAASAPNRLDGHGLPEELTQPPPAHPDGAAGLGARASRQSRKTRRRALTSAPFGAVLRDVPGVRQRRALQVSLLWGDQLLEVGHYGEGFPITLGEARGAEFHVFSPGLGQRFEFVRWQGERARLRLPAGAKVRLDSFAEGPSPRSVPLEDRVRGEGKDRVLELDRSEQARVEVENVSLLVRFVVPSEAIPLKGLRRRDLSFAAVVALAVLLSAGFMAALLLAPKPGYGPSDFGVGQDSHVVRLLMKKPPPRPEERGGAPEGGKAKEEEGKFGHEEAEQEEAAPSRPGSPSVDRDKKEADREAVERVGLLGALNRSKDATSDVFAPGGLGSGLNEKVGGLRATAGAGEARGIGGKGSRGEGPGAGGSGLGMGGLGTQGTGRGSGGSGLELGGKDKESVRVIPGQTLVEGGLSREEIARVIRQRQHEIKYCYEVELNRSPDLSGKVAVHFVIGPDGRVQDAKVAETTLNNGSAERCILSRIRRWGFPQPRGGGVVSVTFPWIFSPAGG